MFLFNLAVFSVLLYPFGNFLYYDSVSQSYKDTFDLSIQKAYYCQKGILFPIYL